MKGDHPYSSISYSAEESEGKQAVEEQRERIPHLQCQRHICYKELQAIGFNLTLIRAAYKKSIEWRLQVQITFSTEVNLAPSRPEYPYKEYVLRGRSMLPAGRNFGCPLMKEKLL